MSLLAGATLLHGGSNSFGTLSNLVTSGEETILRDSAGSATISSGTQSLRLSYFTCRKTESTTQVRVPSGNTAAAATPTLVRFGLYLINGSGDGSLVASTASDTAVFAAANTVYTKSWSVAYAKQAGQRYALAVLVVTAGTAPTLVGVNIPAAAEASVEPRISGLITGQSDLPASFVVGSVTNSATRFYGVVAP